MRCKASLPFCYCCILFLLSLVLKLIHLTGVLSPWATREEVKTLTSVSLFYGQVGLSANHALLAYLLRHEALLPCLINSRDWFGTCTYLLHNHQRGINRLFRCRIYSVLQLYSPLNLFQKLQGLFGPGRAFIHLGLSNTSERKPRICGPRHLISVT